MRRIAVFVVAAMAGALLCPEWGLAQPGAASGSDGFNAEQWFAGTCGFCHSDGGRAPGRGPQLMNSARDDDFIRNRIKQGKQGAMPAFEGALTDAQIDQLLAYIRALKPREG